MTHLPPRLRPAQDLARMILRSLLSPATRPAKRTAEDLPIRNGRHIPAAPVRSSPRAPMTRTDEIVLCAVRVPDPHGPGHRPCGRTAVGQLRYAATHGAPFPAGHPWSVTCCEHHASSEYGPAVYHDVTFHRWADR